MKMVAIVEGHGEVKALPVLLRRLGAWRSPGISTEILPPIRVQRDQFLNREEEFRRHLLLAAAKCGEDGWVLVLLDADDDCPAEVAADLLRRIEACIGHRRTSVVLANREYEAWFIAAAESLNHQRGFSFDPTELIDAETPRDAKGWIGVSGAEELRLDGAGRGFGSSVCLRLRSDQNGGSLSHSGNCSSGSAVGRA